MNMFTFEGYTIDLKRGKAAFKFTVQHGAEKHEFTEKLIFPPVSNTEILEKLLTVVLDSIMLILGISYWKLYSPHVIQLPTIQLTKEQASFWNTVYTKGLGEFFYKNKIDFRGLVKFPSVDVQKSAINFPRQERSLLPLGGGKDSIVVAEMLHEENKPFDLVMVNTSIVQQDVARVMGKTPIFIKRELDSKLFKLNNQENTYNGHIPVSAVYAFLGLFAAVLYDYDSIVLSNEKSANYGNVEYLGEEINHQWSKSEEFEKLFQGYVRDYISPDIRYYSLLRKFSELEITKEFVKHKQYFSSFSSCNKNFKILPFTSEESSGNTSEVASRTPRTVDRWCGTCPKCAFVFAVLSAYLSKEEVVGIFGKNLFADSSLLPLYKELLGIERFKPFECVGTPEETKEAFSLASRSGEYKDDSIMQFFKKEL